MNDIIRKVEAAGFIVCGRIEETLTRTRAAALFAAQKDTPSFEKLIDSACSGIAVALMLEVRGCPLVAFG